MDTSETGLEKIIVDWLRDKNGYEKLLLTIIIKLLPWWKVGWNALSRLPNPTR